MTGRNPACPVFPNQYRVPPGGVLPYLGYTGTCRWTGYGFWPRCPKKGIQMEVKQIREMEAVVLHRVGFLAYYCPKQGQDFKPSAAPLYPIMGQVPSPGSHLNV